MEGMAGNCGGGKSQLLVGAGVTHPEGMER